MMMIHLPFLSRFADSSICMHLHAFEGCKIGGTLRLSQKRFNKEKLLLTMLKVFTRQDKLTLACRRVELLIILNYHHIYLTHHYGEVRLLPLPKEKPTYFILQIKFICIFCLARKATIGYLRLSCFILSWNWTDLPTRKLMVHTPSPPALLLYSITIIFCCFTLNEITSKE